ncbi:MAG: NADH-quinone oxidoreductase subunit J [Pelosinus sp.]|nr:NADH-quinone oxidoreductase subunit J [Pelosinus sp.]
MDDLVYTIAFYILAAITIASAIGVVTKHNLVHSALLMALCFIGISGLYVLLQADFLAAVQILVYSGAVAILIVLGIMLTQRRSMENTNPNSGWPRGAAVVCALLFVVILIVIAATPWHYSSSMAAQDTPSVLARLLFTDYMVAFEAAAVLLLAAMMGAIVLAKGGEEK